MTNGDRNRSRARRPGGFTLIELLVVVLIVILVSVVALTTIPGLVGNYQVTEGARIIQAALAGARDAAIRANAPRGIRLIPDATLSTGTGAGSMLTSGRILPIEPAPDLTEGQITFPTSGAFWTGAGGNPPAFPFPFPNDPTWNGQRGFYPYYFVLPPGNPGPLVKNVLLIEQAVFQRNNPPLPNPPTNWFWNVRLGDRIRFTDSGRYYTVVGPMTQFNPELFVNDGPPGSTPTLQDTFYEINTARTAHNVNPEYLFLVNGVDDNNNGYVDEGIDAVNENLNFDSNNPPRAIVDDIGEWIETEAWLGPQSTQLQLAAAYPQAAPAALVPPTAENYTISRRPVPSPGASEVALPSSVVIDLTAWNTTAERSRLPVDPFTGTVDILLNQAGQVIPTTEFSSPASFTMGGSFYHFWVADRTDVYDASGTTTFPSLPMPEGTPGYTVANFPVLATTFLKKDRRLVTLFARTGAVVTNSINNFSTADVNLPYYEAQFGIREAK